MARRDEVLSAFAIFRWPLALGGITAFGLVAALLGDGIWDHLSWVALGFPVALATWLIVRPGP